MDLRIRTDGVIGSAYLNIRPDWQAFELPSEENVLSPDAVRMPYQALLGMQQIGKCSRRRCQEAMLTDGSKVSSILRKSA